MKLLFNRMIRATKLDLTFYDEIVNDPTSQGHSVWVVALLAMATGYGMFSRAGGTAVNVCLAVTFFSWYIWAFTVYYASNHFFGATPSRMDRKTVLRVMAFASAPGVLRFLGVIPHISLIVFIGTSVWIILAGAIGLKKVYQLTHIGKALILCSATWLVVLFVQIFFMIMFFSVFGVA